MDHERPEITPEPERFLSKEEEEELRKQVRQRLESEHGKLYEKRGSSRVPSGALRAERLRIIREEEDAFYAERGLYRYRNHRGEYEWLTKEEIERRLARRKRHSRRKRSSLFPKVLGETVGDVLGWLTVFAVLVITAAFLFHSRTSSTEYAIDVRSEPPGAAIFLNGRPANASTNAQVYLEGPGTYTVHVVRPGYRSIPQNRVVHVTEHEKTATLIFTLYPSAQDTVEQTR